ncbi:hypothetical protein ACFLSZ_06440 [Candidatus Bipolaricaulota bacterium]
MSRWQKALVARGLIVLSLFLWGCFFVAPVNVTGIWVGTMTWTSGPASGISYSLTLDLVHEGDDISGTVRLPSHGAFTFELPIVQGRSRGAKLSIVAEGNNPWIAPEPFIRFDIEGRFEQTTMSGEGTQSIDGTTYTFDWEAILTTEPVPAGL